MKDMNSDEAKRKNIIDMAFAFSAMARVFEESSDDKIKNELKSILPKIASLQSEQDFQKYHDCFCRWFVGNIKTARRKMKNGKIKPSGAASYGQGAKVFDVALKVFVYYCHLPDSGTANRTIKWLNAAIDTKMMNHLKKMRGRYVSLFCATSVEDVDAKTYRKLQELVREDIEHSFQSLILPVQWDDIMWRKLNNKDKKNQK